MICGRCDQHIRPGEPYTEHPVHAASAAGTTIYRHDVCPPARRA
ncbi:hypothetical protein [Streptomyces sannanensis]